MSLSGGQNKAPCPPGGQEGQYAQDTMGQLGVYTAWPSSCWPNLNNQFVSSKSNVLDVACDYTADPLTDEHRAQEGHTSDNISLAIAIAKQASISAMRAACYSRRGQVCETHIHSHTDCLGYVGALAILSSPPSGIHANLDTQSARATSLLQNRANPLPLC